MVDSRLNEFNVIDFAISIKVTRIHDSLEAVFAIISVMVLHDFEHAEVAETLLQLLNTQGSIIVLVKSEECLLKVTKLFLLHFEPRQNRQDGLLEVCGFCEFVHVC